MMKGATQDHNQTIMQLTKQFSGKLLASDTTKTKVVMNKPDYLGFFIQSFSKIEMDGF